MPKSLRRSLALLLCLAVLTNSKKAHADEFKNLAAEVIIGIVAVTVVVTVGIVLLVKHHPALKGCAATGPDGLELTDAAGQTFTLVGDLAAIKPGDRVRLSGKRQKATGGSPRFVVEGVKDYGPCPVAAHP